MGIQLGEGNGLVNPKWFVNELVRSDDISFHAESIYNNLITASLNFGVPFEIRDLDPSFSRDWVVSGFEVYHKSLLEVTISAGLLVSFRGRYWNVGEFSFVANPGEAFVVVNQEDNDEAVDSGGASTRYDIIEVRPTVVNYEPRSRQFRDPITGAVTSSTVNTKTSFQAEFQYRKGVAGSGAALAADYTNGWVKVAEIRVPASATSIDEDDVFGPDRASEWTTDTSSNFTQVPYLWSPKHWYVPGQMVFDTSGIYQCLVAHRGTEPSVGAPNWDKVYDASTQNFAVSGTGTFGGDLQTGGGLTLNGAIATASTITATAEIEGGSLDINGSSSLRDVVPESDSTYDLGTDAVRWSRIYGDDIYSSSSRRDKEAIREFEESGLDYVLKTKIVRYRYKRKKREKIGFIAEDTPELMAEDHKRMDITNTIGVLIRAVQELHEENLYLMDEIETLRSEIIG